MVIKDETTTLSRHTRSIRLSNGPIIANRKSKLRKKQTFQVTDLVMHWFGDDDPEHVVAHGFYISKHGITVHCKRIYEFRDMPKWMREAIG